eukprot:CAMPEP_0115424176 /NCGR_PEP_ID=MMETSP0271-20121206/27700_1 /TAXON_ID=71861 /ORGANISM="Scrippsiella trochoidea, Strain CCMP3099" /LENGTH=869 /DNA_ID=CAMNT_0002848977 /DNA_START=161 /DNA_END=2767 /DNA_ORIENTATION=-
MMFFNSVENSVNSFPSSASVSLVFSSLWCNSSRSSGDNLDPQVVDSSGLWGRRQRSARGMLFIPFLDVLDQDPVLLPLALVLLPQVCVLRVEAGDVRSHLLVLLPERGEGSCGRPDELLVNATRWRAAPHSVLGLELVPGAEAEVDRVAEVAGLHEREQTRLRPAVQANVLMLPHTDCSVRLVGTHAAALHLAHALMHLCEVSLLQELRARDTRPATEVQPIQCDPPIELLHLREVSCVPCIQCIGCIHACIRGVGRILNLVAVVRVVRTACARPWLLRVAVAVVRVRGVEPGVALVAVGVLGPWESNPILVRRGLDRRAVLLTDTRSPDDVGRVHASETFATKRPQLRSHHGIALLPFANVSWTPRTVLRPVSPSLRRGRIVIIGGGGSGGGGGGGGGSTGSGNSLATSEVLQSLGGRGLCDLLYVLTAARAWHGHREVGTSVVAALCGCSGHMAVTLEAELLLWPQTLPLVAEFLARHVVERRVVTRFLERALAPFWARHPAPVAAALLPHHVLAISAACVQSGGALAPEALEVIRHSVASWTAANASRLRPRGVAGVVLSLSRIGPGPGGEKVDSALLRALLCRAAELVEQAREESEPPFRPDWLGMLLCGLARGRYRGTGEGLRALLAVHLLPRRARTKEGDHAPIPMTPAIMAPAELQNLALTAHAAVKLDVHALRLDTTDIGSPTALGATAAAVVAAARGSRCSDGGGSRAPRGARGARSVGLLAHAFGVGLLVHPLSAEASALHTQARLGKASAAARSRRQQSDDALYESALLALLEASRTLPLQEFRVRFQLLSAFNAGGAREADAASLEVLRHAREAFEAASPGNGGALPGAAESAGGQEWISTKGHEEVAQSLPAELVD